jgi:hypothetical protein
MSKGKSDDYGVLNYQKLGKNIIVFIIKSTLQIIRDRLYQSVRQKEKAVVIIVK